MFSAYNREADAWLDWFDNETIWCRLPEMLWDSAEDE